MATPTPLRPRALELLLMLASEPHNATSAARELGISRATVVRLLSEARAMGACVTYDAFGHCYEVAPATAAEARRRLDLLTSPFPSS